MAINPKDYDFCGWATKNDLRCSDGLIIRKDAFRVNDGQKVPLVYGHNHSDIGGVLGHAILENRPEGVYAYCKFNNTPNGKAGKESVKNGDLTSLSIWANNLQKIGKDILHGVIREVSLVLAGANPGAFVESVMAHGMIMDDDDDEAIVYTGDDIFLSHAIKSEGDSEDEGDDDSRTVGEIFDTLSDEQKEAVAAIVSMALADSGDEGDEDEGDEDEEDEEEDESMQHNAFAKGDPAGGEIRYLSHSDMTEILENAKKVKSFKEALHQFSEENGLSSDGVLAHSIDTTGMVGPTGTNTYGFRDPEMLFPEFKTMNNPPEFIKRDQGWVDVVMAGVHRTPFSRIKSVFADITEDDARARGYMKGKLKKEEFFTLLKRTTTPQTVYKKQKMDRDDVIDIVDFDVVMWIRGEMRLMLNEEIARAILIGDGRAADSDDKIKEEHVRPIVKDVPLFNTTVFVEEKTGEDFAATLVDEMVRARKNYKGSGNPTFFTTEDVLTDMLLQKDAIGHRLYKTEAELATSLRVSRIVTVELMEGYKITVGEGSTAQTGDLLGVVVNLTDYNVGADRGGQINTFDDFDIDYNQMKYLIETRISGALIRPYSALTFVKKAASKPVTPGT